MRTILHPYTLVATTPRSYDDAVARAREALAEEGFGVLCEIDVRETLKNRLGVEREPYLILGACNPPLAHEALELEPDLGTLLPCNVVVYVDDGLTHISAVDPERLLAVADRAELTPIATEIHRRLQRVVDRVAAC
jgi:uncharacterized protein (DUF302 family)